MRKCLSIVSSLLLASAASTALAIQYDTELPVHLGEWNWNFDEAKAIADSQHIPMVLFWGGASCSVCRAVEAALDEPYVLDWQARRKLVMVFQSGTQGEMHDLAKNASGVYPYICVYWNRGDGIVTTNRFSGVVSGSSHWPATGNTIGEHFVKSVELFIGDYQPAEGYSGAFACGDNDGNRLEAVLYETERLLVPMERTTASAVFAATNYLVASYPPGAKAPVSTNVVIWAAGEKERLVPVELPWDDADLREEDMITLTLLNAAGTEVDWREAKVVAEPANCPSNPDWLGEPFAFGRWTFDYDAATNAVSQLRAAGKPAYTLVLYTGALWCPYCKSMEATLLKPGSAFYDWARSNNVALVEFDQGRASSPSTAAGTRSPRLLTYEPDPKLAEGETVSGAGYLSRHEVLRADAERILARTTHYTTKWLAPESTAARLSQPTLLLVKDDAVVARFAAYRDAQKNYDIPENLGRLNDLLVLWDGPGEARDYRTVTPERHVTGESEGLELQVSERSVYYRLDDVGARRFVVTRTDDGAGTVYFDLMKGSKVLGSGTGGLSVDVPRDPAAAEDYVLRVYAYKSTSVKLITEQTETTRFTVTFRSAEVLMPADGVTTFVPRQADVDIETVKGENYRFGGFGAEALATAFSTEDGVTWTALGSGVVTLKDAVEAGVEASYQLWHPGRVGFADPTPVEVEEKAGVKTFAVTRGDGVSGVASVVVTNDVTQIAPGRFELGMLDASGAFVKGEPLLTWADGEAGAKAFAMRVIDDIVCDGDQTVFFGLRVAEGEAAVAGEASVKAVTILEDDEPGPGRLAIAGTFPQTVRDNRLYAVAGSNVTISVVRETGADGEVGATFTVLVDGEETEGLVTPEELVWEDKCRGDSVRQTAVLSVPAYKVGSVISVTMKATGGAAVDASRRKFVVEVLPDGAPTFASLEEKWTALEKVAVSESVGIEGTDGGTVSVRKLTGSLPGGVTAKYDAENNRLVFSGKPTRAGTFTATYQVTELRGNLPYRGGTFTAVFEVQALADAFPVFRAADGRATSRTFKDLFFVESDTKRVTGVLTLTVPASGRLSAKYRCSIGDVALSATGWESWDPAAGTISTYLTSRTYEAYYAEVTQFANGEVEVQVHDGRFPAVFLRRRVSSDHLRGAANPADDWRGQYTLAMPVLAYRAVSDNDQAYAAAAGGSPCFTLKMSARGAINAGRFTWSGWLPNGKGISGSAVLTADGTDALVPIFVRNSSELFAALVSVKGGVADDYEETSGGEFKFGLRAITAAPSALNWWEHSEKRASGLASAWVYDAYGSFYVPDENLAECLLRSGVSLLLTGVADMTNAPASEVYGAVTDVVSVPVAVTADDLTSGDDALKISFNRRTGVLSGFVMLPFEEKAVRANYKAVVLPGWTGCGCHDEDIDLPFYIGAAWFADKLTYVDLVTHEKKTVTVKRGCTVTGETNIDLGE